MIAIDTSSLIAYLGDERGDDVEKVEFALDQRCAVFPPIVISEILSDHKLSREVVELIRSLPILSVLPGYWERSGLLRAAIIKRGFKARLADTLIAQSCIDAQVPVVSRDRDFRHFARHGGLKLY